MVRSETAEAQCAWRNGASEKNGALRGALSAESGIQRELLLAAVQGVAASFFFVTEATIQVDTSLFVQPSDALAAVGISVADNRLLMKDMRKKRPPGECIELEILGCNRLMTGEKMLTLLSQLSRETTVVGESLLFELGMQGRTYSGAGLEHAALMAMAGLLDRLPPRPYVFLGDQFEKETHDGAKQICVPVIDLPRKIESSRSGKTVYLRPIRTAIDDGAAKPSQRRYAEYVFDRDYRFVLVRGRRDG